MMQQGIVGVWYGELGKPLEESLRVGKKQAIKGRRLKITVRCCRSQVEGGGGRAGVVLMVAGVWDVLLNATIFFVRWEDPKLRKTCKPHEERGYK